MRQTFDAVDFLRGLAEELVDRFEKAGQGTTPSLVGAARENDVRRKLEQIFPQSVGIGSGCVIDSYGHTSRQIDVVMFEKHVSPVFSVNETPEATYYPCEGVIAVGEIKSTLGSREVSDAFSKIKSAKQATRSRQHASRFRKYCSRQIMEGAPSESYSQIDNVRDQLFGFILCGQIALNLNSFMQQCAAIIKTEASQLLPNLIISLRDGAFVYVNRSDLRWADTKTNCDYYYNAKSEDSFQLLLWKLNYYINKGRTSDSLPFERYVLKELDLPAGGQMVPL